MDTDALIKALQADTGRPAMPLRASWRIALGVAAVLAFAAFLVLIGPRPDIAAAMGTVRFLFKFVVTVALAVAAFHLIGRLSRPGADAARALRLIAVAPLLLAAAVLMELAVVPPGEWAGRLVGRNSMVCLTFIPLIGIGPLAVFLAALRHGAPTRPTLAGAVAGVLAGGVAATFYAAHCTDDSPLFVATWYTIAITGLAALGAAGGRLLARW